MDQENRFPVIGIGASAGGIEALQLLFRAMPKAPLAAAFVVVTHLGSGHESALPAILHDCTAMPVAPACDGDSIKPGHAYVLPNDAVITIAAGRLRLQRQDPGARRERQPIDVFFASLADELGERAAGVVLSGTGSDGTLGLKAIKERGGLTMVQGTDGSAPRYPEMPASAVASGAVDLIISVEKMPERLAAFVSSADAIEQTPDEIVAVEPMAAQQAISVILRERVNHDFSGYKDKTFFRRVHRRMQVLKLPSFEAYLEHLRQDQDEAGNLFRDLLIGVTGFFRDEGAFAALEHSVLPALFEGRGIGETVRVWVPGCATGEEAYSLAILLREHMEARPNGPRVQVFATDIDEAALGVARSGRYPAPMVTGVSQTRLARHFAADGATYAVSKEVRDLCVFSGHSIIRDAPFSRIDLVSCRNLLIYMGGRLQEQVIPLFHYALRPGGFLFLGVSESISRHADLFTPEDRTHRIFRRRQHSVASDLPLQVQPTARGAVRLWPAAPRLAGSSSNGSGLRHSAEGFILDRFAPAHVVVDRDGDILHQSTRLGKYLEPAAGSPSRQLLSMARRGLRPDLRAALREAAETQREVVRSRVEVQFEGMTQAVELTVAPLLADRSADPVYVIAFRDLEALQPTEGLAGTGQAPDASVTQIESELRTTRDQLQSMIEEYETTAEELKSANEEMVSVNEELQSINEELETSKEELQSINEELRTANTDLSDKNGALDQANADLRNLFDSTQVATIFLDRHLLIRGFTPAIGAIFALVESDVGRSLAGFSSELDHVNLRHEIRSVLHEQRTLEQRVTAHDGTVHYLMRILPYRTAQGEVDGAVITFVDVSKIVEGEALETLVSELNHRVKNMLQVVSAVATHTLRRAPSLQEFGRSFLGRLQALGRAHELVSLSNWSEVSLQDLILKELHPYAAEKKRLVVSGPPVRLKPKSALALGMVLHELSTNAAKYGALSTDQGVVTVVWSTTGSKPATRLILSWTEQGGPRVQPAPERRGFGSELIERQLRYDLNGVIEVEYLETGLRATLTLPSSVVVSNSSDEV